MSGDMSAALAVAVLVATVFTACATAGAPGQIQATPAVHRTTLPSGSPGVPDYGY